jgi:hypothetical protein
MSEVGNSPVEAPSPCTDPKASEFDFWVGTWNAQWGDQGRGTNVITKALGGCVILENFRDQDPGPESLAGMSVSTYVPAESCWKQTWVDNQGGYLDFKGGLTDGRMILARQMEMDGHVIEQRMVWYDLKPEAFEWNWERSDDGGESWNTLWHIHYTRQPEG